jgi:nucleoside recognition membrane protein YjiH
MADSKLNLTDSICYTLLNQATARAGEMENAMVASQEKIFSTSIRILTNTLDVIALQQDVIENLLNDLTISVVLNLVLALVVIVGSWYIATRKPATGAVQAVKDQEIIYTFPN